MSSSSKPQIPEAHARGFFARGLPTFDLSEIKRAVQVLFESGTVVEVRVPKVPRSGTVIGYFDDHLLLVEELSRAAQRYAAPGIYYTLNPCDPALLARAANRFKERAEFATADPNILRRVWLPIDLDPVRPTGISSSEEEHALALERGRQIARDRAAEWGDPIIADSGNGAHLLYKINYPNNPESLTLITAVLERLAKEYSDDRVLVDPTIANAARIWKAYGTPARKGDFTTDRPHRLSRILSLPGVLRPIANLDEFTRETNNRCNSHQSANQPKTDRPEFLMEEYLARQGWRFKPKAWSSHAGGWIYELEECPFNAEHKHGSAACTLLNGTPGFRCQHHGCADKTIQDLFHHRPPGPSQPNNHDASAKSSQKKKTSTPVPISAEELLTTDLVEPEPIIDDLLYPGVAMVAGRPKVGKSWLALLVALALITGQRLAEYFRVRQPRRVLYLALEEPKWRTKRRLKKLLRGTEPDALRDLHFVYKLDSLYAGGAAQLDQLLSAHTVDVVIVDTLLASTKGMKQTRDLLRADYADIDIFQQIAEKHKVTVIVIHHTRKPSAGVLNDDIDSVTGTSGTTAAIDCIWHLRRAQAPDSRVLSVTGRDVESEVFELKFALDEGGFLFSAKGDEVDQSAQRRAILDLLATCEPGESMTPKQIANALKKNESTVRSLLQKLYANDLVCKTLKGRGYFVRSSGTSRNPEATKS